ncbi:MAG: glycosyltransferase [Bacteroidetes bacterium]|nr:glycosyltransferase [Bacteroidota bacterium]
MMFELGDSLLIGFGAVVAIQLFYYLFFFSRLAFHRPTPRSDAAGLPVSVVICTRDEVRNLRQRLPSVLEQSYEAPHEVLVVNDNSMDDTAYLLDALQLQYPLLKSVNLHQEAKHIPGKKFPLAIGIKSARHELVLLTDADCSPSSPHWLQHMQSAYASDNIEIVLGYGGYERRPGLLNRIIRFETFHSALQYLSYALAGIPYMGVGRNLSYRRDLFFRHKGFSAHNQLPGGDDDLFINLAAHAQNTAIMIDREALTHSEPKATFRDWKEQKRRHYSTGRHYHAKHQFLLGLYAVSHVLLYPLFFACLLRADPQMALGIFGLRLLLQGLIFYKVMRRLEEGDLWPWYWLLDLWQWLYYLIFIRAPWMKPRPGWK